MIRFLRFILAVLALPFKSKWRPEAENAVLRHVVRRRLLGLVRFTNDDRWFLSAVCGQDQPNVFVSFEGTREAFLVDMIGG